MGSRRPRSNPSRSPRSPDRGESQGERARLRRNRPLTWRSALLWLIPLVLLAAGSDVVLVITTMTKCPNCGGHHVPLDITAMALAFTALAVYACVAIGKDVRTRAGGRQAATVKHRDERETP